MKNCLKNLAVRVMGNISRSDYLGLLGAIAVLTGASLARADGINYTVKFLAARPFSYEALDPAQIPCPTPLGGASSNPLNPPANSGSDDARWGNPVDGIPALSAKAIALGQVVAFETLICAHGNTGSNNPENGAIQFDAGWSVKSNSGFPFGYDPAYGVYCAFIDPSDPASQNLSGNEVVTSFSSNLVGSEIQGTFNVAGLDDGECAVVESWVVLDDDIGPSPTGSVDSRIIGARTLAPVNDSIQVGQQHIPLESLIAFYLRPADVGVQISDSPDPVDLLGTLKYGIEVTNSSPSTIAHRVRLTDVLDPNTTFASISVLDQTAQRTHCSHDGSPTGGQITCNLRDLQPLETVKIVVVVLVGPNAPVGPGGPGPCTGNESLCSQASVTALNDGTLANNSASQPTGVQIPGPFAAIHIDKAPDANVVYAGSLVTYTYLLTNSGTGAAANLSIVDDKCSPVNFSQYVSGNNDAFLQPGESWQYTCAQLLNQTTTNTATVSATDQITQLPLTDTNSAIVTVIAPEIQLVKTAFAVAVNPGTAVTYQYRATNTGNDPLDNLSIVDDKCSPVTFSSVVQGNPDNIFDPAEVWDFSCTSVLNLTTTNTAQATGIDSLNNPVLSNAAQATVLVNTPTATPTDTPTPTVTATATATETPTAIPTDTPTAVPTDTPTAAPTNTPNPTATPDVAACTTVDNTPQLFALDGSGLSQKNLVKQIAHDLLLKSKNNSKSNLKFIQAKLVEASKLYVVNWSLTWSLPGQITTCTHETSVCVHVDLTSSLNAYAGNAVTLSKIATDLINFGTKNKTLSKHQASQFQKKNAAKVASTTTLAQSVPTSTTSC